MTESQEITIWGRCFILPVVYDCYKGESVTEEQLTALNAFIKHPQWIANSKSKVEAYCKDQVLEDSSNQKKDSIFSYLKPKFLYVKREKLNPRVAIICDYRYDIEHGLIIVFTHDGKITVAQEGFI